MHDPRLPSNIILESSPLSIYLLDSAGYFKHVNRRMVELSGYSKEELVGSHFTLLVHSEDMESVMQAVQKRFERADVPNSYEFRAVSRHGEIIDILGFFKLIDVGGEDQILGQILDITRMKNLQDELAEKEARYRTILENSNVGYFEVDLGGNLTFFNDVIPHNLGYTREELLGMNNRQFTDRENQEKVYKAFNKVYRSGETQKFFDWELIHRDGSKRVVETSVSLIKDKQGDPIGFRGIVQDVTERKTFEQSLKESELRYRAIFEGSGTAMIIIDEHDTITMLNQKFEGMSGYSKDELEGRVNWKEFVDTMDKERVAGYHEQLKEDERPIPVQYEFVMVDRYGNKKDVLANMNLVPGRRESLVSMQDLTHRKQMEEELKYLSFYDGMTGLYNRNYFEQELERCRDGRSSPIGVVVCDVDGLKQVNDTFGHKSGDKLIASAAEVIKSALRESDMVARIGGDEFGILLPKSDNSVVMRVIERIKKAVQEFNHQYSQWDLSISIGYAVEGGKWIDVNRLFTQADNNMYKNKFHSFDSARSDTIRVVQKILEVSEITTEEEQREILNLAEQFANYLQLNEIEANELSLLAQFHELGKLGVWDSILFKKDFLDSHEFEEVIKHCNKGYQIAQKANELVSIADYILTHHERYDGMGYPLGLQKEEIPFLCRIMSILETYCAMIHPRPYREAKTHDEAMMELKARAGSQFDPDLVDKFVHMMDNHEFQTLP